MNIANNQDFKKCLKEVCTISQNFMPQGQMYNFLAKSYYCVMENTTVNAVNAAKNYFVAIKCIDSPKILILQMIYLLLVWCHI